jgi:hypothetical protein
MFRLTIVLMTAIYLSVTASPFWGGPIPAPLREVVVSATTSRNGDGTFTYRYRVMNPAANEGHIRSFDIDISRARTDAALSRDGLVNGPRYLANGSEDAFQRVAMVPVGIMGPSNWVYGLGFDDQSPPRGFAGWGSVDEPFRIRPGGFLEGFQLTSHGLPTVRTATLQPGVDYENLPEEYSDVEKARELRDSLIFVTVSIGPKAPPRDFAPMEFLNYLISLLHQSRAHAWVTRDGAQQSLLAKLVEAKRKLEDGNGRAAKNVLNAFLNEVRATSCQQFTCRDDRPLTSEAYALLFFNGQYLVERLP